MPEPYESLRGLLEFYRDGDHYRAGGVPFSRAWTQAVERVCKGLPDGDWWSSVFASQCATWRRCFELDPPTRADRAFPLLAAERGITVGDEVPLPTDEPSCAHCSGAIPDDRKAGALYCSDRCRRDAAYGRERETDKRYSCAA